METETIQNPWDIDTGKLTSEHEESTVFPQRKKKRDDVWHVITNETGETAKGAHGLHALVDAARFVGGARSLERRAVTGA